MEAEKALAAALHDEWDRRQGEPSEPGVLCPACIDSSAAILASLPSWFFGNPAERDELARQQNVEIVRLRAALEWHLANPNRPNEGHQRLRAALAESPK